jgi:hypothetical protein
MNDQVVQRIEGSARETSEDNQVPQPGVSAGYRPWDRKIFRSEILNALSAVPSPARLRPQPSVELNCTNGRGCSYYRKGWCHAVEGISYSVRALAWCPLLRGSPDG